MGTNYYLRYNLCSHCNRYEEIHIGKRSAGWKFLFYKFARVFPIYEWENNAKQLLKDNKSVFTTVDTYKGLKLLLKYKEVKIYDEYRTFISSKEFCANVESQQRRASHIHTADNAILFDLYVVKDPEGYEFTSYEFS